MREQVRKLRTAAQSVLGRYGISATAMHLLAHHRQTTFRIDARDRRYVLRFQRTSHRRPDEIRAEFCWLRHLHEQSDLVIPEPVSTLDGEDVLSGADGLPEGFHCSVLKWVEGKRYFRKHGPGVRVLGEVGRIMGTMHNVAELFARPRSFACPIWDWERLFGQKNPGLDAKWIDAPKRQLFAKVERRVRLAMDDLGTGSRVFGVIHGDVMQANYLVHHRRIHIIDFADFGLGHFLYDMAITLFALWRLDPEEKQRQAFLAGYREAREFSWHHEQLLNVFIAGRGVVQARFVMASEHPDDQRIALRYIRHVGSGLETWLA